MIDHISIGVSSLKKAKEFYDAALKPLGYACVFTVDIPGQGIVAHGYGEADKPSFWIGKAAPMSHSSRRAARRSTRSTRRRSRPAPKTMAPPALGPTTTRTITAHLRMTRTATRSKLAAIIRNELNETLELPEEKTKCH